MTRGRDGDGAPRLTSAGRPAGAGALVPRRSLARRAEAAAPASRTAASRRIAVVRASGLPAGAAAPKAPCCAARDVVTTTPARQPSDAFEWEPARGDVHVRAARCACATRRPSDAVCRRRAPSTGRVFESSCAARSSARATAAPLRHREWLVGRGRGRRRRRQGGRRPRRRAAISRPMAPAAGARGAHPTEELMQHGAARSAGAEGRRAIRCTRSTAAGSGRAVRELNARASAAARRAGRARARAARARRTTLTRASTTRRRAREAAQASQPRWRRPHDCGRARDAAGRARGRSRG